MEERPVQPEGERFLFYLFEFQVEVRNEEEAAAGGEAQELAAARELQTVGIE